MLLVLDHNFIAALYWILIQVLYSRDKVHSHIMFTLSFCRLRVNSRDVQLLTMWRFTFLSQRMPTLLNSKYECLTSFCVDTSPHYIILAGLGPVTGKNPWNIRRSICGSSRETGLWPALFESRLTLTQARIKVNRSINFSCIKLFFIAYILCSLWLFKLQTERQTM